MDKNFKQLVNKAKELRLSQKEKSSIRDSVLNFISLHPVRSLARDKVASPKDLGEATSYGTSPVRPSAYTHLNYRHNIFVSKFNFISATVTLLTFCILVGGGVSVGAEKALPGDVLYPVKIGVNEEVKGWFAVSEGSKANWEIERVQRRLEEAETLAENGSLSVKAREKIEANFEAHADQVKKRIEKFENKEDFYAAVDISSKFETSLKAHQKILNRLTAESKEEVKKEVRPIHSKVKSQAKALTKTRKKMELRAGGNANIKPGTDGEEEDNDE